MSNKKSMNELFGKGVVKQSKPDAFWPLASELIGLEIETEGFDDYGTALSRLRNWWTVHSDASLRNGVEWVLSAPLAGGDLKDAINAFFDGRYSYSMSERTSTHIHINASDNMTVDTFRNVFTLMYLIEPAVFRWADENRKWCGYCQPLTDMSPARLSAVLLDSDSMSTFVNAVRGDGNSDRYYGLNVAAFNRHGTLEFRYFPCTDDRDNIFAWVKFVMQVKRAALAFDNPMEILSHFEEHSKIETFLNKWFDDNASVLSRGLDYSDVIKRSLELQALVTSKLSDVIGSATYRTPSATTKALTKLLAKRFGVSSSKQQAGAQESPVVAAARRQQEIGDIWRAISAVSAQSSDPQTQGIYQYYNMIRGNSTTTTR